MPFYIIFTSHSSLPRLLALALQLGKARDNYTVMTLFPEASITPVQLHRKEEKLSAHCRKVLQSCKITMKLLVWTEMFKVQLVMI